MKILKNPYAVKKVVQEAHDVYSLYFEGKKINYKPGQFMVIRLKRGEEVSEPHPFTISSSPTRNELAISVKALGDFSSSIKETVEGDLAYIDAPYGVFSFLNHDGNDLVFIAGGIGITPFISMLRYMADKGLKRNVVLLWGNKTEEDIPFREELDGLSQSLSSFKLIHVLSSQEDWTGEKGHIDRSKISKYVKDIKSSEFFVCGPPPMMKAVVKTLEDLGVSKDKIQNEIFQI
ncbi:MAG: hypothetical protein JM58_11530 [Peptococcaceae bacterium BICA1-8]|nr:MAG: hypothetical protein JM58_11530 [Peptococcaceae bacterium BICA1-8]